MRALVVTLRIDEIQPNTEDWLDGIASAMASVEGLLSTYWLRSVDQVMLIQTFATHRDVDMYLNSKLFTKLGRIPGSRDVFVTHYDVSTRLNRFSVPGSLDEAHAVQRDLVPA